MNLRLPDTFPQLPPIVIFIVIAWSIFWKAIALWRAAKGHQKNWFIVLLIIDTLGILEMVYLFRFAKNKLTIDEIKSWLPQKKS